MKKIILSIYITLCVLSMHAYAASISLSPAQLQIAVGKTQVFRVLVNTQGVAINTAEGTISFDPKLVQVISINKANSVLNLWIEEPSFSNATGKITFNGGAVTPGFTGSAGELFTITARGVKEGSATFAFSDVSIHQNDGSGTDVTSTKTNSTATITSGVGAPAVKTVPAPIPVPVKTIPNNVAAVSSGKTSIVAPTLVSNTHPDQTAWYSSRNVDISWVQADNAYGMQSVFDSNENTLATGPVQSGITAKHLRGVRSGTSYLHVRQVGSAGVSPTSHFVIRVDTEAPTDVQIQATSSYIEVRATDEHSGIDHVILTVGTHTPVVVPVINNVAQYLISSDIESGSYEVQADVFDKAGNYTEFKKNVDITHVPVYVIMTDNTDVYVDSDVLFNGHTSVKNGHVSLSVKNPDQKIDNFLIETDATGVFTFTLPSVKEGEYIVWGEDEYLGKSNSIDITVRTTYVQTLLRLAKEYGLIAIIILLLMWVVILSCRLKGKKTDVAAARALRKLEDNVGKSTKNIKEEAKKQLVYLEQLSQVRALVKAEKERVELCKKIVG